MGQKVNPHGFRVGVIKDWDSRWYASNEKVGDLLVEDHKIRVYLKKLLFAAGVSKIEIERSNEVVTVYLHVARPGVVIGKGGVQIEEYRKSVEKLIGKTVKLNIVEVRNPDMDAQLVAENIAAQLEKRISHRRAMKNAMGRAMRAGAKGIKVNCSGRLGGREIAGSEHYHEGTIPLQTLRADIDYGFAEAATTFGRIGVKVWIYKGEILSQALRTTPRTLDTSKPYQERRERRGRRDGDRRGGFRRDGQGFNRDRQNGGSAVLCTEDTKVFVVRCGRIVLTELKGATVSVFPFDGSSCNLTYEGLQYPLEKKDLSAGSSLMGVSNCIISDRAEIRVNIGCALVIVYTPKDMPAEPPQSEIQSRLPETEDKKDTEK